MCLHVVIPRFLRTLEDIQIKENEDAHFSCEVYPDEIPVKWFIDGTQIAPNDKFSMPIKGAKRHLHIKKATKEDQGRVSAMIGDDLKSSADLSVEGMHTDVLKETEQLGTHLVPFGPPSCCIGAFWDGRLNNNLFLL